MKQFFKKKSVWILLCILIGVLGFAGYRYDYLYHTDCVNQFCGFDIISHRVDYEMLDLEKMMKSNQNIQIKSVVFSNEPSTYPIYENGEWVSKGDTYDAYGIYDIYIKDTMAGGDIFIAYTEIYDNREKLEINQIRLQENRLIVTTNQYECVLQCSDERLIDIIASTLEKARNA